MMALRFHLGLRVHVHDFNRNSNVGAWDESSVSTLSQQNPGGSSIDWLWKMDCVLSEHIWMGSFGSNIPSLVHTL